jgi:hypothetical protein
MKRLLAFGFFCVFSCCLHAQAVDAAICDILKSPQSFNGKIVRIKGTVSAGFDEFVVRGPGCGQNVNAIWLSYPEGTKGNAGPAAMLQMQPARNFAGTFTSVERTPVSLERNKDFEQFDSLLSTPYQGKGMCLGCIRYMVNATLVGRLDGVMAGLRRGNGGKIIEISGYGNLNAYSARLVLQSVSDISSQEIDYSKDPGTVASSIESSTGRQIGSEFGNSLRERVKQSADAYGKRGENNGVAVGPISNEASKKDDSKGTQGSPDGVLFNCGFDFDRLKKDSLARAMTHMGEHIADLRNPDMGNELAGLYQLEFRAWVITVMGGFENGQKILILPGGFAIYRFAWPSKDMSKNMEGALTAFLTDEALLIK